MSNKKSAVYRESNYRKTNSFNGESYHGIMDLFDTPSQLNHIQYETNH